MSALLLLIRHLCLKLGVVIRTGDFNKCVEREAAANGSVDQRRISLHEAVFSHAKLLWPTYGVKTLLDPGGEPQGGTWPDCCCFVVRASHRVSGFSCAMGQSMSSLRPSA